MNASLSPHLQPARPLIERIEREYRPAEIWLFGSRARGDSGPTSDWDFLVVVPDDAVDGALDPMRAWQTQKDAGVPADVIVCTESDFRDDRETVNTIGYVVGKEGVRVFERTTAHSE